MLTFILFLQFLVSGALSIDPRAVQMNLETSLLFHPKDNLNRKSVINNINTVVRRLQKHFTADKPSFRTQNMDGELTTFFLNLGELIMKQNDDYLKNFTNAFAYTLEDSYFAKDLSPIFGDDSALQAYVINNSLNKWHLLSVQEIKANIKEALETDDTIFHKMIQCADRFFNESDRKPLADITRDLTGGNEERKDLAKVIKGAVNYIIVKKFKSLDNDTKVLLQNEFKKVLYGHNKLDDNDERELDSNVKIKLEKVPEIKLNTDKKDLNTNQKDTNEDKKEVDEALKEIKEDLERRIKRRRLNENKMEINSEEKIKKEGEVQLKHVEEEIRRFGEK